MLLHPIYPSQIAELIEDTTYWCNNKTQGSIILPKQS